MGNGRFDVAVIGAGIAGASVACALAEDRKIVLLERESQPGYHTTGRSAALFSQTYGPPAIRALSRASKPFFDNPPQGFTDRPLLSPRGSLMIARPDQGEALAAMQHELAGKASLPLFDATEVERRIPLLRKGYAEAAILEEDASDIDVHALHQAYLRAFRARGGMVMTQCEMQALERQSDGWRIMTPDGDVDAAVVVNAAGAWADEIAGLAGARPVGLLPKRRTALVVAVPDGLDCSGWPMVVDIEEQFYLKPDAGRFLISPADETPSPPCDAQPEEMDIAICADRIETAFDMRISHIANKWAGLRSFVADKTPVAGYDPRVPGFFWLAGQGGYGIQTAPALARAAAALIRGEELPPDISDQGVDKEALSAARAEIAA